MKKIALLSLAATTAIMASGWRIPEQSVNATALAGAYVANASGADAAYYNPANMAFMDQGSYFEGDLTYIHLTSIDFDGTYSGFPASASSKKENFVLPTLHYVGEAHGDYRFGISLTVPGGLSKRWEEGGASTLVAKEFTLEVFELNPVVSYKVADNFALAAGLRFVYSKGVVKSSGTSLLPSPPFPGSSTTDLSRDMEGDDIAMGVNLAASYKPIQDWTMSATYRSKVDLEEKGSATLSSTSLVGPANGSYNGDAGVTVPLPAVFALATSYTFDGTTVELEFDRTFWGDYNELDFTYPIALHPVLAAAYDDAKPRNWNHANAYRLGVTHVFNEKWTGMLGYAYDETGAPTDTISFELPDSDANLYSLGVKYNYNKQMTVGLAGLYDDKKEVTTSGSNDAQGTFKNAAAYLVTLGFSYKF